MIDNFSQIFAHFRQVSALRRLVENNAASGVFAFVGPEYLGTKDIAFAFCASVLGVPTAEYDRHPDVITLEAGVKENGTKAHDIDRVRDMLRRIGQRAMTGKMTVIIEDADLLNANAQNALLKTLEEPAPGTTIILLASDEHALLPTIRSRVTTLYFFGEAPEPSALLAADAERLCHPSLTERLLAAQDIAKRDDVPIDALCDAMIRHLKNTGKCEAYALDAILTARDRLRANGNSTVVLTECAVQLAKYE